MSRAQKPTSTNQSLQSAKCALQLEMVSCQVVALLANFPDSRKRGMLNIKQTRFLCSIKGLQIVIAPPEANGVWEYFQMLLTDIELSIVFCQSRH